MRKAVAFLLSAALFFAVSALALYLPQSRISRDAPPEEFTAFLDARIPKLMRRYAIPGAGIAVVHKGQIVYSTAYGYADRDARRPMAADMPMRVQSISKSVTAWAVLKMAEEGKLNLDDPVEKYIRDWKLPASGYAPEGVTVRRLLCHSAGMPLGDVFSLYAPGDPMPTLKESLTNSAVVFQAPGKGFSYSNVGYNLLELLIEEVSGRDFSQYMKNEILEPLGMEHADFTWSAATLAAAPLGYTLAGKAVPSYQYPEKASGGLLATAEDIARFCIAGMPDFSGQRVLTRAGVEQLYAPQAERLGVYSLAFDAYGSGYYTERLSGGELAVSHGGQGTGWMSHFHAVPETGDAVVILANSQRSWPFIASILHAWARWEGFSAPGMTRILLGECLLWALVGLICAAALSQIAGIAALASSRHMKPFPLQSSPISTCRKGRFGLSIAMLGALAWCAGQRYLFLTAVFPAVSGWLGGCAAALGALWLITSFGTG